MAELNAELLACSNSLERKRVRRIWEAQGARRRRVERRKMNASAGREVYSANGEDARLPRRLATQASKHTACLHARTRRCARGGRVGQGRRDPYRITVADPYPLFLVFVKFGQKFELKPKTHQNKSCAKFYKLQIIF